MKRAQFSRSGRAPASILDRHGAKGLNLAATDVKFLSAALIKHYRDHDPAGIDTYSQRCLHRFADSGGFDQKLQEAELDYLVHSEAGSRALAENYVGLPLDFAA